MTDDIAEPVIVNPTDATEQTELSRPEGKAFRRLIKTEVMRFPVFTQGEILPLKYRIREDMREVLCRTHGKDKKAVINAVIDKLLKDYCSQVKRPDYALAAVLKQHRYDLHGKPVQKISEKDMTAFVAALRYHERLQREALERKAAKERKRLAHEQRLLEQEQARRAKRTAKRKRQRAAKAAREAPTVGEVAP
ncbi:MAG: ProQ/FINO family protein [Acidithiobacillus sp.]|nr:ProQ/FINO family protein [Acidithiobacillus sp.]